jgi:hypothetical protein
VGDPVPLFADFVRSHEAALVPLIENGVTNTNEVGRSAVLLPAFAHGARTAGQGLHLVELGPSAGFNLNFDRYLVRYARDGGPARDCGPEAAPVRLECSLKGPYDPPYAEYPPVVLSRRGLELNPVDLNDPSQRLWLKALVWPELTARHARLDAAIAEQLRFPVPIFHGDAIKLIEPAIETLPPDGVALVFHSHVTYQFTPDMRGRLDAALLKLSTSRPVQRVSIEYHEGGYPIRYGVYTGGAVSQSVLGFCDPHGMWLEWLVT